MNARLTHIQVSNFRSIRGGITVPLDAPVVLVHGPNGSGKTSLLSAIELGLTGAVGSLKRFDPTYIDNLAHRSASDEPTSVIVQARHEDISTGSTEVRVNKGEITGDPLLSRIQRRFFSERAFLAQATLSRLLEIYEASDARQTQSPLTRFVNDLLGLDQLDALIEGLHASRDKRRLIKSLPLYGEVDELLDERNKGVHKLELAVASAVKEVEEKTAIANEALAPFGVASFDLLDAERSQLGDSETERKDSIEKAALKRDVEATVAVWRRIAEASRSDARDAAEKALSEDQLARNTWRTSKLGRLEKSLDAAGELFSDLSSARSIGWRAAHDEALEELTDEQTRLDARLARDDEVRRSIRDRREALTKAVARQARLDETLGTLAADSGTLAEVLSEMATLIDSEMCPVCLRDFSETGSVSLRSHLASHISSLSQSASRLKALADERQSVRAEMNQLQKSLSDLEVALIDDKDLATLRTRRAKLAEALSQLEATAGAAREGDTLEKAVEAASERLATLRQNEEALLGARRSVAAYTEALGLEPLSESEGLEKGLDRCLVAADLAIAELAIRERDRKTALGAIHELTDAQTLLKELEEKLRDARAAQLRVKRVMKDVESVRAELRKLSDLAVEARTDVVREVFNESLNKVWNNLFIRLAPEEPFLPSFELPDNGKGPVEAKLITRYRGDHRGGNPKAMLSAGNLNTAALTLFLSLHLSVKPLLPWLVIDDPVQSMDEIHIAQFAALLRTLSKQRGRQVIIAVHERPLFEYLALELSPASPGDKLITVELSKDAAGKTICEPHQIVWNPETVYRAVSA